MKTWFTSLNGALLLSAAALLSFIGYTLMEMRYFLAKWIPGDSAAMIEVIVILLIAGGWLWALWAMARGKRSGLIALLALSVFNVMIGLYDMPFVLNSPMPWPEQLMVVVILIVGVIVSAVLFVQLRQNRATAK